MPQHGFDKNLIRRIFFFNIQRGDPLDFQKWFLQCRGVIFQQKKICVFGSLSNMSNNGLRMVVCLNFDITHLSPPSNTMSNRAILGHILALSRPYWVIWVMLGWGHVFAVRHSMAQIRQRKNKIRLSKAQRMPIKAQRRPMKGQSDPIRPIRPQ